VPYVELGINLPQNGIQAPAAVAEIVVGPGSDQEGQTAAVRDLLQTGAGDDTAAKLPDGAVQLANDAGLRRYLGAVIAGLPWGWRCR
jgi:hypothetical protein